MVNNHPSGANFWSSRNPSGFALGLGGTPQFPPSGMIISIISRYSSVWCYTSLFPQKTLYSRERLIEIFSRTWILKSLPWEEAQRQYEYWTSSLDIEFLLLGDQNVRNNGNFRGQIHDNGKLSCLLSLVRSLSQSFGGGWQRGFMRSVSSQAILKIIVGTQLLIEKIINHAHFLFDCDSKSSMFDWRLWSQTYYIIWGKWLVIVASSPIKSSIALVRFQYVNATVVFYTIFFHLLI